MKGITLRCETCEQEYQIKPAKNKKRVLWLITLSLCPRCGTEKNPETCRLYDGQKRCKGCHLPESILPTFKQTHEKEQYEYKFMKGLCLACYKAEKKILMTYRMVEA